jgi:uncharacterized iron-regulated membrane protein
MSSNDALIALACITVVLVVGAQCWRWWRRDVQRRARTRHYRRAGYESRPQHLRDDGGGRYGAISPARAAAIGREAQQAAQKAAESGRSGESANPYAGGTPEFVLWIATYHLTLTELDEQASANGSGLSRQA